MKRDKLKIYLIEVFLIIVLCLALFVSNVFNKKILALVLLPIAILTNMLVKKKKAIAFNSRQVTILMVGFGIIYLAVFYILGMYFGYYKSPTPFGFKTIINFIIPFTVIVISSEFIRKKLIIQKGKLSKTLLTISMVLIDLVIYAGVYDVFVLDDMLTILGFILFASVACNLLYNYVTYRFGSKGVIIYRLMTIMYAYFIPYIPDIYIFFRSFLRMLYPYLIYLVLEYTYSKSNYAVAYKDKKRNIIATAVLTVVMSLLIGLISCKFRYGILVIGSGSMTGNLDLGDAVLYESYHNQDLNKKDVIIFYKENTKLIHRIVNMENINGEIRYYTKGDANENIDSGYITKDNVIGTTIYRIRFIGYPTLWLRDIFED